MSIDVMSAVWKRAPYEGGSLLVLLALADWGDDDGTGIFPTVKKLATKARLTPRAVQLNLKKLREDGVIILVAKASGKRGHANEWRIDIDRLNQFRPINEPAPADDEIEHKIEEVAPEETNDPQPVEDFTPSPCEDQGRNNFTPKNGNSEERTDFTREKESVTGESKSMTGEVCSISPTPPYIDIHHLQPSLHPPSARASEQVVEPNKDIPAFLLKDPVEAFMRAGVWHPGTIFDVRKELLAAKDAPAIEEIIESAKRYLADMDAKDAKRKGDPIRRCSAATFIRKKMWNDYPPPKAVGTSTERKHLWGGHPAVEALCTELGEVIFDRWFARCRLTFVDGQPILYAPSTLVRDELELRYWKCLNKAFGAEVTVKMEKTAPKVAA